MKTKNKIVAFCLVCFVCIGCDRATKGFAKLHLKDKPAQSYFHNTVRLEYVENTGAFLSFGENWPHAVSFWALSIFPLLFLSGFFVYAVSKAKDVNFFELLPFAFIFSGGVGNIVDRILYDRHVIDFMNLGIVNLRTGIFNFADICVTTGVLLLMVNSLKK